MDGDGGAAGVTELENAPCGRWKKLSAQLLSLTFRSRSRPACACCSLVIRSSAGTSVAGALPREVSSSNLLTILGIHRSLNAAKIPMAHWAVSGLEMCRLCGSSTSFELVQPTRQKSATEPTSNAPSALPVVQSAPGRGVHDRRRAGPREDGDDGAESANPADQARFWSGRSQTHRNEVSKHPCGQGRESDHGQGRGSASEVPDSCLVTSLLVEPPRGVV